MKSLRTTNITTAKAVIQPAPRHVILGKKRRRGNLRDSDIFCDFLVSFCHAAMERCTPNTENWLKMKFGPEYEHLKCSNERFERYVEENCQLAEQYIASGRLLAFEICMVTPSEQQLIGFRITLTRRRYCRGIRKIYERFSAILEKVRTLGITANLDAMMHSCKYRPRIRMLTRLRPQSKRKKDRSQPGDSKVSVPLADSFPINSNSLAFYAFM
ncbi:hypothetical protein CAEBREN_08000 [Caenorhabditis brenneri]|uniref:Uncharacterized protein n=1 Tax=Caenorhabditis brenneri TaxID=135651 RepID=G0N2J9_CAEBE|nr:hypothetical protein CAEBREN_08000 [Caenorhabditis brenneri]